MKNPIGLLGRPSKSLCRVLLGLFVMSLFVPMAGAQYITPTVGNGQLSPRDAPCVPYEVGPSTGTTEAALVNAATGSKTPGWVSWVAVSSAPTGSYIILKDTGSVSNTGINSLTGRIAYSTPTASAVGEYQVFRYDPPALFQNGLTVKVTGCATGCFAAVCVRKAFVQYP